MRQYIAKLLDRKTNMHFRVRNNIIQIIRTSYDEANKKSKSTILGRLNKNNPVIEDQLRSACSPVEITEIEQWIQHNHKVGLLKAEHAANTLKEHILLANEWFSSCDEDSTAELLASEIQFEWQKLRKTFKKRGLLG